MATIFVGDESGSPAFAISKSKTPYFVIALVSFEEPALARVAVEEFKRANDLIGVALTFHTLSSESMRTRLFQSLTMVSFQTWALVIHKDRLDEFFKIMSRTNAYLVFLSEALRLVPLEARHGNVLVLKQINRAERIRFEFARILKALKLKRGFKTIAIQKTSDDVLLQIADVIAGAVYRKWEKGNAATLSFLGEKIVVGEYPLLEDAETSERGQMQWERMPSL